MCLAAPLRDALFRVASDGLSLCTMVSNSATTVHHSCQLIFSMHSARDDSVCNHSCDWCRRDGAAHRVQSAIDGRRARRLAGSGSEPSAAPSLLHTAPQLRTAGRDEQTSCKSRREQTQSLRPVSSVCCSCGAATGEREQRTPARERGSAGSRCRPRQLQTRSISERRVFVTLILNCCSNFRVDNTI